MNQKHDHDTKCPRCNGKNVRKIGFWHCDDCGEQI